MAYFAIQPKITAVLILLFAACSGPLSPVSILTKWKEVATWDVLHFAVTHTPPGKERDKIGTTVSQIHK